LVSVNEALMRRAIDAIWNRGDLDVADELFAPDYVNHYGLITDLVFGPEAIKISAALYRVAFPGLRVRVEEVNVIDDTVVLRWSASSSSDVLGSNASSSAPRSIAGTTRSLIADRRIVESWTEWDRIGVLGELGLLPDQ
jgi:hypothetical protein